MALSDLTKVEKASDLIELASDWPKLKNKSIMYRTFPMAYVSKSGKKRQRIAHFI